MDTFPGLDTGVRGLALLLLAGAAAAGEPVRIPMRDGAELAADVHRPDAPGRYPTILVQTPYWLRGRKDNGWADVPRVRLLAGPRGGLARGAGVELAGAHGADPLPASGRALRAAKPEAGRERGYRYDPRRPPPTLGGANLPPLPHGPTDHGALDRREDLLVFSTGPLDAPIRLQGNAALTFRFRANRTDCDFFARLCARPPDGPPHLIVEGAQRAKLRRGEPEPLVPGRVYEVTVRLAATAATFDAGWELRLYLSSGNSPRYERNPHTGADRWSEAEALGLDVRVACDGTAVLRLPRFK